MGNPDTIGDPGFMPLGAPASNLQGPNFTPPFPAYTSGHATFGAAHAAILRNFFGTDNITFTLNAFGSSDLRNLDNNTFLASTDVVPTGAIAGNPMTIQAAALLPALTFTLLFNNLVTAARRRAEAEIRYRDYRFLVTATNHREDHR